jgi:hypothetical protein
MFSAELTDDRGGGQRVGVIVKLSGF